MITDDKSIIEKLKYIGLDLEDIPVSLKKFSNIDFRPPKNVTEKSYKVYKYINVKDVEILLTPADRLTDLSIRYTKSVPLSDYFNEDDEFKQMKYLNEFLKLTKELNLSDLEELEEQQKEFHKQIPYSVKFKKDYIWQIYYSEISKKYFMLVPTKDMNCSALFYILKKKIENSKETIFVPICYMEYDSNWLKSTEFEQLENYLWFFTKKWPAIYNIFEKRKEVLVTTGTAVIYDNIKSNYKMVFNNNEELKQFFILIKTLFILQTEISNLFRFKIILTKEGRITFYSDTREITYENIKEYIKDEYVKVMALSVRTKEEKMNLQKILKNFKSEVRKLEIEYFEKEKFISTFLECKKTFFGRVKYFFKYKKAELPVHINQKIEKDEKQKLKYFEKAELKDIYTLDELVIICKELQNEENEVKNLRLDIDATKTKIDMMDKKISNANQYIKEIDDHKKSIFDFWKFTSKDEAEALPEGSKMEKIYNKAIKRAFNFETDFEETSKQIDKMQRANLSPKEIDSIFLATTPVFNDLRAIKNNESIDDKVLEKLKLVINDYNKTVLGSFAERIKTLRNSKAQGSRT